MFLLFCLLDIKNFILQLLMKLRFCFEVFLIHKVTEGNAMRCLTDVISVWVCTLLCVCVCLMLPLQRCSLLHKVDFKSSFDSLIILFAQDVLTSQIKNIIGLFSDPRRRDDDPANLLLELNFSWVKMWMNPNRGGLGVYLLSLWSTLSSFC